MTPDTIRWPFIDQIELATLAAHHDPAIVEAAEAEMQRRKVAGGTSPKLEPQPEESER